MAIVAGSCNVRRLSGLRRHGKPGSSVGLWQLVYCCTYVRRRLVKRLENDATLIAEHGLCQIAQLHAIGATVRSRQPTIRLAARAELAAPIVAAFRPWLEAQLARIPRSSKLTENIRYTPGI